MGPSTFELRLFIPMSSRWGCFGGLSSIVTYPKISTVKVDPSSAQPHVVSRREGDADEDYILPRKPVWYRFDLEQYGEAQDSTHCQSR